ncbi:kinesin-like protein KIN-7G [Forsythia ovata]|uniref:Kinesin-like protein KIN-7G n=1 Tax=Forsythia ovata TaxID=205694 RepID=A0ABD1X5W8_9LAMI
MDRRLVSGEKHLRLVLLCVLIRNFLWQDLEAEKTSKEPEKTTDDGSKTYQDIHKSASDWSTEFEPEKTTDDGSKTDQDIQKFASDWSTEFERQKREIIELWNACCTPLVHRTYFLLLFKGDPSDAVYMEVELRRLSFLKNTLSSGQVSAKSSRDSHVAAFVVERRPTNRLV